MPDIWMEGEAMKRGKTVLLAAGAALWAGKKLYPRVLKYRVEHTPEGEKLHIKQRVDLGAAQHKDGPPVVYGAMGSWAFRKGVALAAKGAAYMTSRPKKPSIPTEQEEETHE